MTTYDYFYEIQTKSPFAHFFQKLEALMPTKRKKFTNVPLTACVNYEDFLSACADKKISSLSELPFRNRAKLLTSFLSYHCSLDKVVIFLSGYSYSAAYGRYSELTNFHEKKHHFKDLIIEPLSDFLKNRPHHPLYSRLINDLLDKYTDEIEADLEKFPFLPFTKDAHKKIIFMKNLTAHLSRPSYLKPRKEIKDGNS